MALATFDLEALVTLVFGTFSFFGGEALAVTALLILAKTGFSLVGLMGAVEAVFLSGVSGVRHKKKLRRHRISRQRY
jgi:hypothetical protein